jgi:hypothetical protein
MVQPGSFDDLVHNGMTTSSSLVLTLRLTAGLSLGACDVTSPEPQLPPAVLAFVTSEALPQAQEPRVSFRDFPTGILLFDVAFGPPQDCLAGCFYASAAGLQIRDRVGWWGGAVVYRPSFQPFDIKSSDTQLFDPGFLQRFRSANSWLYDHFTNFLACDPDTPSELRDRLRDASPYRPFPHCPADF